MLYASLSGFTDLHRAAQRGDAQEVASLLDKGADPTARDSEGRMPLHHAVMRGHLGVVDVLLSRGGPSLLLVKDILNCTPVHLAAVQNQVTLIIRLVDSLLEDEQGRTPLHEVARRRCMQDFMGFLHLGWESATIEDDGTSKLSDLSPLWSIVGSVVDLKRPGLPTVQRVLGWHPLHVAAMSGNIELIKRLVQQFDCDLKVKSMNSWTPLHYAAAYNQIEAIEALCALGCEVSVQDAVGSTPMHVAAGEGHLNAIKTLVRLGCSPEVTDRDGCTPLYCAAAWNRIEAVRLLEELQCPSSLRSLEGRTPVHVAAEQGWVDLIDVLATEFKNPVDACDNYQFTPMHSAANGGHVEAIRRLAGLSHDLNAKDYLGRTPLHYAAMHGRSAAVDALVELGAGLEEKDSRGGYTPLHLAADAGQCETISRLVAVGATIDSLSSNALSPLSLALMKGPANVDAIALLVELGANVSATLEQRALETPLHVAARAGCVDIIHRLVKCPSITIAARTKDGSTPLHYAAAFGQSHVLEVLVTAGCPVDSRDNALNTPMHLAAGCGFLDTVVKLIELGGDINARDCTDCTPLQNAAHGTYSALAEMPAHGGAASGSSSSHGPSTSGYARFNPPHQPQLTPAQQAAQAALTSGSSGKRDGLVPVRTGLAWSHQYSHMEGHSSGGFSTAAQLALSGNSGATSTDMATAWTPSSTGVSAASASGGAGGYSASLDMVLQPHGTSALLPGGGMPGGNPTHDLWATWKSLGLTQLLKKAYRQQQKRQDRTTSTTPATTAGPAAQQAAQQLQQTQQTVQAALQQMQAALQQSQAALQQQLVQQLEQRGGASTSSAAGAGTLALDVKAVSAGGTASAAGCMVPGTGASDNLDALLRRNDQLHLPTSDQDRSRLIKVVEKLVDLGADLHAVDNEGRTALHLAAGCGDRSMALRLVELGTDVNCRDSVGGTAMHHAAMANKKDMMFSLARLGCDWRSRADGIDGATASFVLCGQHGKTTRQQRLLDAKLKRVFQEGSTARAAGRNPLADARDDADEDDAADLEAEQAMADAAMAALLKEVEAEEAESARKAKKKKKKASSKGKGAEGRLADDATPPATPIRGRTAEDEHHPSQLSPTADASQTPHAVSKEAHRQGTQGRPGSSAAEPPKSPAQMCSMPVNGEPSCDGNGSEASEHDPVRLALDAAADAASRLLSEQEELDEDALEDALEDLDAAVDKATAAGVSAKYGKKVRKKLQVALDRMRGIYVEPVTEVEVVESTPTKRVPAQPPTKSKAPLPQPPKKPGLPELPAMPIPSRSSSLPAGVVQPPPPPPPRAASGASKPVFAQGMQPAMLPPQAAARQQGAPAWGKPPPPPAVHPGLASSISRVAPPPPPPPPPQTQHAPAPVNYAAAAAGPGAQQHFAQTQQQQQQQPEHPPIGHLFSDAPTAPGMGLFEGHSLPYDAAISPRRSPSPHSHSHASALFGDAPSFFAGPPAGTPLEPHFSSIDSYGSGAGSLNSHFNKLDLSLQAEDYHPHPHPHSHSHSHAPPTPLDSFIGLDLAAQVFGGEDGGDGGTGGMQGQDPGASLLSIDLLGELDGVHNSTHIMNTAHQRGNGVGGGRLSEDAAPFYQSTQPVVGMPGSQDNYRSMW